MSPSPDEPIRYIILVVDDMPICREPIVEFLRAKGFTAVAASSGEEALGKLDADAFDLVILDVDMPGMDGLEVLREIRERWSHDEVPVLLLTDVAERSVIRKAAELGVRDYMLKAQFTTDELVSRIGKYTSAVASPRRLRTGAASPPEAPRHPERPPRSRVPAAVPPPAPGGSNAASELPSRDRDAVIRKIRRTIELQPVPPVLHFVVSQTQSGRTSMRDVADAVRQDQALALRVMKVANSSFYRTGHRAENLVDAAGRLGMSGIRNAVFTVVSMEHFQDSPGTGLIPQRFWEHALGTAGMAQSIAQSLDRGDAEDIFLAALLCDVGRIVLGAAFPDDYRRVLEYARHHAEPLNEVETKAFGLTHAEATREVLTNMRLSQEIITAASLHEEESAAISGSGAQGQPAMIVALADRLAGALILGDSGDPRVSPTEELADGLAVERSRLGSIGRETAKKISDTELFYACQGTQEFLPALASELADGGGESPSVSVLSDDAPHDALSLFFEQLGWLNAEQPDIAVVYRVEKSGTEKMLEQLAALDQAAGSAVGLLIVATDGEQAAPAEFNDRRPSERIRLPASYADVLSATRTLALRGRGSNEREGTLV